MSAVETRVPVLEARGLVQHYGVVTALNGADFDVYPGEILALIGDNGAGKSSLIKALSGAIVPDQGEILLNGTAVHFRNPLEARRSGIETVYQDLALAPALDIAENLFLGRELRRHGIIGSVLRVADRPRMLAEARSHIADLKINVGSMKQAVETLSGGQRQGVAVARAAGFASRWGALGERGGDHGRADGGAGRPGVRNGAGPDPHRPRPRNPGRPDQPQHA